MPRRALHYVDSDVFGGSEEAALQVMGALDGGRWEPVLLHHPGPGIERLVTGAKRLGVRTVVVPRVAAAGRVAGVIGLARAIRAERPAIVHAHLSWPLACKHGTLAARLARVPAIVGTAQLYVRPDRPWQARLQLAPLQRIIAVSREVATRYAVELRVPARRLAVVHNGIQVPAVVPSRDPARRAEMLAGGPDYLVFTPARLHQQKGHGFLLEAAARVPDATFVLAGDGPLRAELEAQARSLGIADRCRFLGQRSDVPELMAAADLFVLPSLYEGLPVSVLEAMAAARPVVATAIGGTDEAITHEATGLLVPPRDPESLAAAIRRLQADPRLAASLAVAGRERVEREFSVAATARGVTRIYEELTGPAGPGAEHG